VTGGDPDAGTKPEKSMVAVPDVVPAVVPKACATTPEPKTTPKAESATNVIVSAEGVSDHEAPPMVPGVWVSAVTNATPDEVRAAAAVYEAAATNSPSLNCGVYIGNPKEPGSGYNFVDARILATSTPSCVLLFQGHGRCMLWDVARHSLATPTRPGGAGA
jgi:hypothetical protein